MTEYRLKERENRIQSISANFRGIKKKTLKNSSKNAILNGLNAYIGNLGCLKAVRAILKRFK